MTSHLSPSSSMEGKIVSFTYERSDDKKKIAILTSGGDSCGMNPAIRAVVRAALIKGADVYAIRDGYNGMVNDSIIPLTWSSVAGILNRGGTIIGTARSTEFRTREGRKKAAYNLIKNGINNLVVIGGDGSLTGANLLRCEWSGLLQELVNDKKVEPCILNTHDQLSIVGMVGSIDNDMCGTDITIGADTAAHRILEAIDSILSTAVSHQRSFVIEVMGRNCGVCNILYNYIYYNLLIKTMTESLEKGRLSGRRCSLVIVAEGAIDSEGKPITSSYVREVLEKGGHDARITILGHVQRGGVPTFCDRYVSTRMSMEAINYLYTKTPEELPALIGMVGNRIVRSPLMKCVEDTQKVAAFIKERRFDEVVKLRGDLFENLLKVFNICANIRRTPNPPPRAFNIAILHSGGPSPGMNPAVRAFARLGIDLGFKVYGIFNGFSGLAKGDLTELSWMSCNGWSVMGGAELGTNRSIPNDTNINAIVETLKANNIGAIMMFGGYNGYVGVSALASYRDRHPYLQQVAMVCAPGTIANNVPGTENSIGSDTCLNNILDALDKIKQSAVASRRLFVVEVMGAHCGYLCAMSALASGAECAYTMEEGVSIASLTEDLKMFVDRFHREHKIGLIIKSESASNTYSTKFIYELFREEGKHLFDVRESILGHLQQGGNPSSLDRLGASRLMYNFYHLLQEEVIEKSNRSWAGCIGIVQGHVKFTELKQMEKEINHKYRRPEEQWWIDLLRLSREISVSRNDNQLTDVPKVGSPTIYAHLDSLSNPLSSL
uniref:6-phosphofructokinase n=1 Tax=Cavenderia deminutiva TaxID=361123 RepID=A0A1L2FUT3_9MYCE|nr:phosphofructokinase [Cavenderia deminutiva]